MLQKHFHSSSKITRRSFFTIAMGLALAFASKNVSAQEDAPVTDSDEKLRILPYLQNPSPDAMTVCFLSTDASDVKVDYVVPKASYPRTVKATSLSIPKTNWKIWKARLTGLKPGIEYSYRVIHTVAKEEKKSETYTFKTPNWSAKSVSAIAFNDVHDKTDVLEALLAHVKPEDYEYSFLLGDMWNDPSPEDNARRVFMTMEAYVRLLNASSKPMFYVRGNHDTRGGFAGELSYLFDLPHNNPVSALAQQNAYYEFQAGPVWFISPDAGEDANKRQEIFQPYRQRQVDWLKNIFSRSPSRKAPWRVIPMHIPLYTPRGWDQPDALKRWEAILNKERIDLMIAGHDHTPHLVEKGKVFNRKNDSEPQTPPYPVLVGGGPNMKGGEIGTVMFLKADAKNLDVRLLNVDGKELWDVKLKK